MPKSQNYALALFTLPATFAIRCGTVAQQRPASPQPQSDSKHSDGTSTASAAPTPEPASKPVPPNKMPAGPSTLPQGGTLPQGVTVPQQGSTSRSHGPSFADQMRAAQQDAAKLDNGWTPSLKDWKISTATTKPKKQ